MSGHGTAKAGYALLNEASAIPRSALMRDTPSEPYHSAFKLRGQPARADMSASWLIFHALLIWIDAVLAQ